MRKVLYVMLSIILSFGLFGCSRDSGIEENKMENKMESKVEVDPLVNELPKLKVFIDNKEMDVQLGDYMYYVGDKQITTPAHKEELNQEPTVFKKVKKGSKMALEFSEEPKSYNAIVIKDIDIIGGAKGIEVDLKDNKVMLPKEKGKYVIMISAEYTKGNVVYGLDIEIK
ncbi:hypothetical protein [Clostridium sp. Marseille-QA1073]